MNLRLRHEVNIGADQARALALSNPGGGSGDDGLSTGDVHGLEEEPRELADHPLHDAELDIGQLIIDMRAASRGRT